MAALPLPESSIPTKDLPLRNDVSPSTTVKIPTSADVLILGGGPAALSCALGLSRQLYTTLIFSSPNRPFRNERAKNMHNVLTWDHNPPAKFREAAKNELVARYSTNRFVETEIVGLKERSGEEGGGFEISDIQGNVWTGKKVVLATGSKDVMPDIEGYDECWGHGIFHCLFCHGYEERGSSRAGVLAIGDLANATFAPAIACQALRLAKAVVVFTHGNESLAAELEPLAAKFGFTVDSRRITRFSKPKQRNEDNPFQATDQDEHQANDELVAVHFADASEMKLGFIAHKPITKLSVPWQEQLPGLKLTPQGDLQVNAPFNETTVPGVFAAGDCMTPMKAVVAANMSGAAAAAGIAHQVSMGR